ncbi:MAG: Crp/Fnr family transcriptional regulator [Sphaerochaetaceae bacterium]|nr:Crp/Fnr family transcriptional regulator [Sphaerochaetaceae bacterium]
MKEPDVCSLCRGDQCIRNVPLFASLEPQFIHALAEQMEHTVFHKGELLVREGEKGQWFTVIREGSAKAYRTTGDGREQILYIFPTNDYFGARFLFTDEKVPYSVQALEETRVCMLSKSQFSRLLSEHSTIAMEIIEAMAKRMSRLESVLQSMGGRNADVRVASLLVDFKDSYGTVRDGYPLISLPLSREGLANYLGLARETLSRKLSQLEEEGIIEAVGNHQVRILDIRRLEDRSIAQD